MGKGGAVPVMVVAVAMAVAVTVAMEVVVHPCELNSLVGKNYLLTYEQPPSKYSK